MKSVVLSSLSVAASIAIPGAALANGSTQHINFESIPLGTNVNGLSIDGITFSFSPTPRGTPTFGATIGDPLPTTPDTQGRGITGPTNGVLGMLFSRPVKFLDFGFGLRAPQGLFGDGSVRDGVIVKFFGEDSEFLGSMSTNAFPPAPPLPASGDERGGGAEYATGRFASGNMRIGSVELEFPMEQIPVPALADRSNAPIDIFLVDNISFEFAAIPLPSPALLGALGLAGMVSVRRRRAL